MSCMEREKKGKKLDIDYDRLIDNKPPPEILVMDENLQFKSDSELNEMITRNRTNIQTVGPKLPDKGEKLKLKLKQYEEELERRQKIKLEKDTKESEEPIESNNSSSTGVAFGNKQGVPRPFRQSSKFATLFSSKFKESNDSRTVDAFEEEITRLSPCERRRFRSNGQGPARGGPKSDKNGLASRNTPFRSPATLLDDVDEQANGGHSSTCSPRNENFSGCLSKRNNFHDQPARNLRPRNERAFVLVDEDEPQPMQTMQQVEKLDDSLKEVVIYYPSRDDPESVEISYLDMECLAPETFLSSPIINFYIRYLQNPTSPSARSRPDYHFFNTYFYKKLKEAVDSKQNEREALFLKFRRWWKGVNIFAKAYILLPVHEHQHWSLVIICFPDKEDESAPILLHLDSLGLHYSKSIFESIRSFLKQEWNYLRKEEAPLDQPITGKIWQKFPRRMDEKIITVPQQRNDYDCGVFVLYFMERFIEDAPERLRKKDLEMFGKKWFEPEEASGLRHKIRSLLLDEFKKVGEKKSLETEKEEAQSEELSEP